MCVCLVSVSVCVSVAGVGWGPRSFPSWKEISSGEGIGCTAGRRDPGEGGNLRLCRKSPRLEPEGLAHHSAVFEGMPSASGCLLENGMTTLMSGQLQALCSVPADSEFEAGRADASCYLIQRKPVTPGVGLG